MPIYEFRCEKCNEKFEALCGFSNIASIRCPSCSSTDLVRVFSTFGSKVEGQDFMSSGSKCSSCTSSNCSTCG